MSRRWKEVIGQSGWGFFFQAEDGIRDLTVTGVQTCALPIWVHVDGAFGLWAKAAPTLRQLAHGVEHADSWATDAHKWLNVPCDSGLAFAREIGRASCRERV